MNDEPEARSVDLVPLGEVEAPDVVERAIRRFRWRVFLYVSLPVVLVLLVLGVFLYVTIRPNLDTPARIQRAARAQSIPVYSTARHEVDDIEVLVLESVELRPGLGERLLNGIFQREHASGGPSVGVHLVIVAPHADEETQVNVHPKDWSLLEHNVFADAASVAEHMIDPTMSQHWFIIQPGGRDEITFVIEAIDRKTGNAREVGEFSLQEISRGPGSRSELTDA